MEKKSKNGNQNIQVVVRLRPLNQRERDIRSLGVVEVCNSREVLVRTTQSPSITKKFTFDRAFGPDSKQEDVYREVVNPLIEEVLAGYNCTVFAYGQTGTGKTHTMVGESSDHVGSKQSDPMAGIIPRSLGQLFDELRLSNSEFTVRVSYLELYNEELFDLLAPGNTDTKLKLLHEASKGSSEVRGLEEIRVRSKDEVYQILAQGQERRRIASTLMNAQSSRSHTVFTIVVKMNIKESGLGEELVKTGKLNLVDLAGSENISKAGSDNPSKGDRKRECVVINQSLLTLGRVITALVERQPHIPYRESKLTRLLQESLGGRTKTCIVATISPGHKDLEETLSTLEYAHRARNIQNKPEVNQKVLKTTVLTEYVDENDRLRRDLMASWEKNGVYLSLATHTEHQMQLENQKKEIQEQILQIKIMKEELERLEADLEQKIAAKERTEQLFNESERRLTETRRKLQSTSQNLTATKMLYDEQCEVVRAQVATERTLAEQARAASAAADAISEDAYRLHNTVAKRRKLEEDNVTRVRSHVDTTRAERSSLRDHVAETSDALATQLTTLSCDMRRHADDSAARHDDTRRYVRDLLARISTAVTETERTIGASEHQLSSETSVCVTRASETLSNVAESAAAALTQCGQRLLACLDEVRERDRQTAENVARFAQQWRDAVSARISELERAHAEWQADWRAHAERMAERARTDEAHRRDNVAALKQAMEAEKQEMQESMSALQQKMAGITSRNQMFYTNMIQLSELEEERLSSDVRAHTQLREDSINMADLHRECVRERAAAVTADAQELSESAAAGAHKTHAENEQKLQLLRENLQVETHSMATTCTDDCAAAARANEEALRSTLDCGRKALHSTLQHAKDQYSAMQTSIESLSNRIGSEHSSHSESSTEHTERVLGASADVMTLRDSVDERLARLDHIETDFVERQYEKYSPTGATPMRQEYRFPREFASTSPHERIIARLKARRLHDADPHTIDLDKTLEGGNDDEDSSVSSTDSVILADPSSVATDSSSAVFVEPRTPAHHTNHLPPIHKATSESELYNNKKCKREKENSHSLSNASSMQKLSKLRQPSSARKVLTPKNSK